MDIADALIVCRALHFGALLLLAGTSAFVLWSTPDDLRRTAGPALSRLAGAAVAVAIVTTPFWLMLEAGVVGDGWSSATDPATLSALLGETGFGRVWIWRLVLAGLLLGVTIVSRRRQAWGAVFAVSTLLLASLAFVGHAAGTPGQMGVLHRLDQSVHLIAAAFWVGGLPPLWICLGYRREPSLVSSTAAMLRRFSRIGHFAVAAVVATGVVETWLIVGRLPDNPSSAYQVLLDAKIAVVALMVGIAIFNRYRAVPMIDAGHPDGLKDLIRGTVAEIVLSIVVVALVSAFGTFDPG